MVTTAPASASFRAPWGDGVVVVADGHLVEVSLPDPEGAPRAAREPGMGPASPALGRWVTRLEDYFSTGRPTWDPADVAPEIDSLETTAFRRAVYHALAAIPAGETVSYGELAALAGHPRAARAVGSAMAANPLALVVPCHRVVRSDGSLGRYGDCDAWKAELLALEGAPEAGGQERLS
jgi:methylated-DNA-[protein]-cysteine S-methyltransferase